MKLWTWTIFLLLAVGCGDSNGNGDPTADTTTPGDTLVEDVTETDLAETDSSEGDTVVTLPDATTTDVSEDIDETLPPAGIQAQFQNCSEPGGDRNIYDLQTNRTKQAA